MRPKQCGAQGPCEGSFVMDLNVLDGLHKWLFLQIRGPSCGCPCNFSPTAWSLHPRWYSPEEGSSVPRARVIIQALKYLDAPVT